MGANGGAYLRNEWHSLFWRQRCRIHLMERSRYLATALAVLLAFITAPCYAFSRGSTLFLSTRDSDLTSLMANQNEVSCSKSTHSCFSPRDPPYLAVITEPDACDSKERMDATIQAITSAVSTGKVALVSIRVVQPKNIASSQIFEERVVELTTALVSLAVEHAFHVVVTSDWVEAATKACAHGIHVKEHHCSRIPVIRQCFQPRIPLIGTSAHSISSALKATSMYQPDYLFVGTCYATASHPEKMGLEGPQLPGRICRELEGKDRPVIFAIGGIDEENCAEPVVKYGSDGVAAIRSILQSSDPAKSVEAIMKNMKKE